MRHIILHKANIYVYATATALVNERAHQRHCVFMCMHDVEHAMRACPMSTRHTWWMSCSSRRPATVLSAPTTALVTAGTSGNRELTPHRTFMLPACAATAVACTPNATFYAHSVAASLHVLPLRPPVKNTCMYYSKTKRGPHQTLNQATTTHLMMSLGFRGGETRGGSRSEPSWREQNQWL